MRSLPRIVSKRKKRVGRGYGSGKGGHTVGRGQKGQKARESVSVVFQGVKVKKSLLRRLPLRKGKGKFKAKPKPLILKLRYLNLFPSGSTIDLETLISKGLVKKDDALKYGVKILGDGEVEKKLIVNLPISKNAAKKIEAKGGKVLSFKKKR